MFIQSFFKTPVWIFGLWTELSSVITNYFETQIVPDLASGISSLHVQIEGRYTKELTFTVHSRSCMTKED